MDALMCIPLIIHIAANNPLTAAGFGFTALRSALFSQGAGNAVAKEVLPAHDPDCLLWCR